MLGQVVVPTHVEVPWQVWLPEQVGASGQVNDPWQVAIPAIVGLQSTMHEEYPMQVGTHPHVA